MTGAPLLSLVMLADPASSPTPADFDTHAIVGAGASLEADSPSRPRAGIAAFGEIEPIEDWLEIEAGAQWTITGGARELSLDLLFKKPFHLLPRFEFMLGLGPTLAASSGRTSWGAELAVDLMFWPSRHLGIWAEPAYDLFFGTDHSRTVNATFGPIARW